MEDFRACILDLSNEPCGVVNNDIVREMGNSLSELKKNFSSNSKYNNELEQLYKQYVTSQKKYSANYLNALLLCIVNSDDDDFKKMCQEHFDKICSQCKSGQMREKLYQETEKRIVAAGFKTTGKHEDEYAIFNYNGKNVGFPILRGKELYWMWKKCGSHKTRVLQYLYDDHSYSANVGYGIGLNSCIRAAKELCEKSK